MGPRQKSGTQICAAIVRWRSNEASSETGHMTDSKVYVRGGNPITRYKAGSREPECVEAHRAYSRAYSQNAASKKEGRRPPLPPQVCRPETACDLDGGPLRRHRRHRSPHG